MKKYSCHYEASFYRINELDNRDNKMQEQLVQERYCCTNNNKQ